MDNSCAICKNQTVESCQVCVEHLRAEIATLRENQIKVRCGECKHNATEECPMFFLGTKWQPITDNATKYGYCHKGEKREEAK